uniref:Uncharacterized protein n=1 Tax=Arundo donax TaxID=35708 RepID=A0A0A9H9V3_ARUDO
MVCCNMVPCICSNKLITKLFLFTKNKILLCELLYKGFCKLWFYVELQ